MIEIYFPKLKPHFDAYGFKVFNCNPNSRLTVFPHLSYDEAIKRSTDHLSIDTEISHGMYRKFEDKMHDLEKDKRSLKDGKTL